MCKKVKKASAWFLCTRSYNNMCHSYSFAEAGSWRARALMLLTQAAPVERAVSAGVAPPSSPVDTCPSARLRLMVTGTCVLTCLTTNWTSAISLSYPGVSSGVQSETTQLSLLHSFSFSQTAPPTCGRQRDSALQLGIISPTLSRKPLLL